MRETAGSILQTPSDEGVLVLSGPSFQNQKMPTYHVTRSTLIRKPENEIMAVLRDFHQWPAWSPWLIMEPEATLEYNGPSGEPGSGYSWSGKLVGAGSMQLEAATENHLDMNLQFFKPFKSQAQVCFDLTPDEEFTKVTWHMTGRLPFFMSFMMKKMRAMIGMDYDRGLSMLKDYVETGIVRSRVLTGGITPILPQEYVGLKNECHLNELDDIRVRDFGRLQNLFDDNNISTGSAPFTIHQHLNMESGIISLVSALPVMNHIKVEAPFFTDKLAASSALKVTHTGHYEHLGNAWSTAMSIIIAVDQAFPRCS